MFDAPDFMTSVASKAVRSQVPQGLVSFHHFGWPHWYSELFVMSVIPTLCVALPIMLARARRVRWNVADYGMLLTPYPIRWSLSSISKKGDGNELLETILASIILIAFVSFRAIAGREASIRSSLRWAALFVASIVVLWFTMFNYWEN